MASGSSSSISALAGAAGLKDSLSEEMKLCNDSLEALLTSYEAILNHSKTFNSPGDCSSASLRWHMEKMTQSSESLLQMISNLKISAIANDTAAMNARIEQRTNELKLADTERMQALVTLGIEVSKLLQELETHHYSCV